MTDCSVYENCLKNQNIVIDLHQDDFHMIVVGCWGVYCNDGEYIIAKSKKNELKQSMVQRGQKQVSDALVEFTKRNKVTDIYLAGDNVYQLGIKASSEKKEVDEFLENKRRLLQNATKQDLDPLKNIDMDLQISQGFENCFYKAITDRFFLAIGNHDIENCQVLNKQYNYSVWNLPALYYNVVYKLNDFKINIIVLDTNMFEDETVMCTQKPFSSEQKEAQKNWAMKIRNMGDWNIVIGHIPFVANGHKPEKHPILTRDLHDLVLSMKPQLYICADEHNQQYINYEGISIVIAGSGGTELDKTLEDKIKGTLYLNSAYGFVSYRIDKKKLEIDFISTENKKLFSEVIYRI
jgi:hypothetical protein